MSVFRKFKLPQLLRKGPPASEIGEDIPRFKCSELPLKQRLGQGSFGDVYTAEYRASGDTKCHTVVVKKMLQVLDQEEKKLFYKEVRLLNDLQHPNIVHLKGVSFKATCYDARIHLLRFKRPRNPDQMQFLLLLFV